MIEKFRKNARNGGSFILLELLIIVLLGHSALAADRQKVSIGEKTVELFVPAGYCPMDETHPSDAGFMNAVRGAMANSNHLLGAFAECKEQAKWRAGEQPYLDNFGQYITPLRMMRTNIPSSRAQMVVELCKQMEKMSAAMKDKIAADAKKRMENMLDGAKFEEIDVVSKARHDKEACYFSSQQNITTPTGTTKTIAGVSALTLIKGKIVQLNLYTRYKDEKTFVTLFEKQKENITALLATGQ